MSSEADVPDDENDGDAGSEVITDAISEPVSDGDASPSIGGAAGGGRMGM